MTVFILLRFFKIKLSFIDDALNTSLLMVISVTNDTMIGVYQLSNVHQTTVLTTGLFRSILKNTRSINTLNGND